jgi:hypothetical protein
MEEYADILKSVNFLFVPLFNVLGYLRQSTLEGSTNMVLILQAEGQTLIGII